MQLLRSLRGMLRAALGSELAYAADFVFAAISGLIQVVIGLALLSAMYSQSAFFGGWSYYQAVTLYGFFLFNQEVVTGVLTKSIGTLPDLIRRGDLDAVLLKPVDSQLFVTLTHVGIASVPAYVIALATILWGIHQQGLLSPGLLGVLAMALTSSVLVAYSLWTIVHTMAFWFVKFENIAELYLAVFEAARFPVQVYPPALIAVFTYLVPIAFITTVPASVVAGISDGRLVAAIVLLPLVLLGISHLFWRYALARYDSASS